MTITNRSYKISYMALTESDIHNIVSEYKAGKTLREIAEPRGVSKQYIDQLLAKSGVERRPRIKLTEEVKERIKVLAAEGKTCAEISASVGVSTSSINPFIKGRKITRVKREYTCTKCGGHEYRSNGDGRVCVPCSAKRAREYYQTHGKITRAEKRKAK